MTLPPIWPPRAALSVYRRRVAVLEADIEAHGDTITGMYCTTECEERDGSCDSCDIIYQSDNLHAALDTLAKVEKYHLAERLR